MICAARPFSCSALRGALEALFGAGSTNDLLALAEAEACLLDAKRLPELRQARVEILDLRSARSVSSPSERRCQSSCRSSESCSISRMYLMRCHARLKRRVAMRHSRRGVAEHLTRSRARRCRSSSMPEVVRELVEDGDPDLLAELSGIGKRFLERQPIDRDRVGRQACDVAPLRQRDAVVEAEEIGVVGVLVLDDHRDVLGAPAARCGGSSSSAART